MTGNSTAEILARATMQPSGCWEWTGARDRAGYGLIWISNQRIPAHRWAAALVYGPNDDLFVLHHCDNPPCVNPAHLRYGTLADNIADMVSRGRLVNPRGEENGNARLTAEDVRQIRALHMDGEPFSRLAVIYKISGTHARDVCEGKYWKHLSDVAGSGAVAW